LNEEQTMTAVEILPAKQKALIGVGAAIVAGCQPCTLNFGAASHKAGACDRGIRFAVESGLAGRQQATQTMASFASEKLAQPELDAAFRAERAMLDALIGVAAAIAGNTAALVKASVDSARARGATDDQIRMAAETARLAKRGAEGEVDNALAVSLGGVSGPGCCAERPAASNSACGCGCSDMPKQ
jgi:alkylhydroperoxidase/carboxymuconolactone decarboxylase family protein YurZ